MLFILMDKVMESEELVPHNLEAAILSMVDIMITCPDKGLL